MSDTPRPELVNEIHNSNLILHIYGKVAEIRDYAKNYVDTFEGEAGDVLQTIIDKLEQV